MHSWLDDLVYWFLANKIICSFQIKPKLLFDWSRFQQYRKSYNIVVRYIISFFIAIEKENVIYKELLSTKKKQMIYFSFELFSIWKQLVPRILLKEKKTHNYAVDLSSFFFLCLLYRVMIDIDTITRLLLFTLSRDSLTNIYKMQSPSNRRFVFCYTICYRCSSKNERMRETLLFW